MNKFDQYISRQFFYTLVFAVVIFTIFFMIIDLVENLDKFIDRKVPNEIVIQYYIYFIPYIIIFIIPIAVLLSTLFSVGNMARHNELIAMQTSGVSLNRIATPLLILGFVISLLMILFTEYVMPPASQKKFTIKRKYLDRVSEKIFLQQNNINILQDENTRVFISHFDSKENTAYDVMIQEYKQGSLVERVDAKKMRWQDGHWIMEEGISRIFTKDTEQIAPFETQEVRNFDIGPTELGKVQKKPNEMNHSELRKFIRRVERNGSDTTKWLIDLHMKFSFPFSNFVIVLFGIPLAASGKRSGKALGFGISLGFCFLFFGLVKTLQTLGYNGILHPVLASWGSNIIIAGIGILLMATARK